jgi:peptidoglycan/xylan/chitin deacetylase (PgdA/CDA1 family)
VKIVFSYDCEGNWGCIDWETPPLEGHDPAKLEGIYQTLCDRHVGMNIPATFAFVGLYTLPAEQRIEWIKEHLSDLTLTLPNMLKTGGFWEGEKNLATVVNASKDSSAIEIGSHGLTHREIVGLDPSAQALEFKASAEILTQTAGVMPRAFIFPRNLVAGRKACLSQYDSYRDTEALTLSQRMIDMNRAVMGIDLPRSEETSDFMFWKGGHRRHFSDRGWKRLWRARMRAARAGRNTERLIHVWSHPHNFVTDPDLPARYEWLMSLLDENREYLEFMPLSQVQMRADKDAA